uniref:Uncharacterized protein n=1 Tax=Oryza brachyantha TaxID=4533 RepID=J3N238_ORYBR
MAALLVGRSGGGWSLATAVSIRSGRSGSTRRRPAMVGGARIDDATAGGGGVISMLLHHLLQKLYGRKEGTILEAPRSLMRLLDLTDDASGSAELGTRPRWMSVSDVAA